MAGLPRDPVSPCFEGWWMAEDHVLAWDVGTSGVKVVVTDGAGAIMAGEYEAYAPTYGPEGVVEHDLEDILAALRRATRAVLARTSIAPGSVAGVGATGQMFNLVAMDGAGVPLLPMISWLDLRAIPEARALTARMSHEEQFERLGSVVTAKDIIPKILWLRDRRPDIWKNTAKLLDCKDAVLMSLTGEAATDRSTASSYRLLDAAGTAWDRDACLELGIPIERLPETGEAARVTGRLSAAAASQLGLVAGTPVIAGTGDVASTQVGAGATRPGDTQLSLGTALYLGISLAGRASDPARRLGLLGHMPAGEWILWLEIATGGASLNWFLEATRESTAASGPAEHAEIDRLVAAAEPDMGELLFGPWLSGERFLFDDDARAAFVGLDLHHRRGHLLRAVMEGVACETRWAFDYAAAFGQPMGEIRAVGGGSLGDAWVRILADMLDRELVTVENPQDAGARGAAACVLVALGRQPDLDFVREQVTLGRRYAPDPARRDRADELYSRFKEVYAALRPDPA
jgi:xylulokinase